jgi:hypothetical protein
MIGVLLRTSVIPVDLLAGLTQNGLCPDDNEEKMNIISTKLALDRVRFASVL